MDFQEIVERALAADSDATCTYDPQWAAVHAARTDALARLAQAVAANEAVTITAKTLDRLEQ